MLVHHIFGHRGQTHQQPADGGDHDQNQGMLQVAGRHRRQFQTRQQQLRGDRRHQQAERLPQVTDQGAAERAPGLLDQIAAQQQQPFVAQQRQYHREQNWLPGNRRPESKRVTLFAVNIEQDQDGDQEQQPLQSSVERCQDFLSPK